MLLFEYNKTKFIYIHIPKNCGRYIRKQIYSNFECFNVNEGYPYPVSFKVSNDCGYNLHDKYSQIKHLSDNFITFVRNPYHRAISFFYLKIFENNVFVTDTPVIDFIQNPLEILKTKHMDDLISILKSEFKKFILSLADTSLSCQYKYLVDEDGNIPENITCYKLEEPETFSHLEFKNFNLKTYDLSEYYDSETLEAVNVYFKKDFEIFNYPPTIHTAPAPIAPGSVGET